MKNKALLSISFSVLALMSGCSDVVRSEYATYAQAKKERLFDRGWLPDILPVSTKKIEVNNNLDSNTSDGRFIINDPELSEFIATLEPNESNSEFQFIKGDNVWVFKVGDDNLITYTLGKLEDPESNLIEDSHY